MERFIHILGACENNLKDVEVKIPIGKLTVITGDSGSGKSSLAFDVLFNDMKRRYLEVLGGEAENLPRPDVKKIYPGLAAIALSQIHFCRNPHSTIATFTGIKRLLLNIVELAGCLHCSRCGSALPVRPRESVVRELMATEDGTKIIIKTLVVFSKTKQIRPWLERCIGKGFIRCEIDGEQAYLEDILENSSSIGKKLAIIIDRIIKRPEIEDRMDDSLKQALEFGDGLVEIDLISPSTTNMSSQNRIQFSQHPICFGCLLNESGDKHDDNEGIAHSGFEKKIGDFYLRDLLAMAIEDLVTLTRLWSSQWRISNRPELKAASDAAKGLETQLGRFLELGLGYLRLDIPLRLLSSGERQKVHLASVLARSLSGLLYVLDEPLSGLGAVEKKAILKLIMDLKDLGNTVVMVEHDLPSLKDCADLIIELGPGAGDLGGRVTFSGPPGAFWDLHSEEKARQCVPMKPHPRPPTLYDPVVQSHRDFFSIPIKPKGNLKIDRVNVPSSQITGIFGPSGSGKSLLAKGIYQHIRCRIDEAKKGGDRNKIAAGSDMLDGLARVWFMDENLPVGSSSSVISTYMKVYRHIAALFASTRTARSRGITPAYLSLARKGGRCEKCKGTGELIFEPEFLPVVRFECNACSGKRFGNDVLGLRYRGMNLADVLNMTVEHAIIFFKNIKTIRRPLEALARTGLGYLRLGQNVSSLSGGERQRLKLATVITKRSEGKKAIFILDNVTRGLSQNDIYKLLDLLTELADKGHTVVVVENHLLLLSSCSWLIELGPGSGPEGGTLVREGPPTKDWPSI